MKDGIIKNDGTSRLVKADFPATYEEFKRMAAAGNLPVDLLFNVAGWRQVPTFLSKGNLLSDESDAALFGTAADRTVDQAFYGIASRLNLIAGNQASIRLTVLNQNGKPIAGIPVSNVYTASGEQAVTDQRGVIDGVVSEGNVKLTIIGYADIVDFSKTFSFAKGQSYTESINITTRDFLKITSSRSTKFSKNVETVDVTAVGGGGGAGTSYTRFKRDVSGGGGSGGQCVVRNSVPFSTDTPYNAVIGAGGSPGDSTSPDGKQGGSSSFLGVSATGGFGGKGAISDMVGGSPGVGGKGNGDGADGVGASYSNGKNGTAGIVQGFDSFTTTTAYGGGGGSGAIGYYNRQQTGGTGGGYGGNGGDSGSSSVTNGTPGLPGRDGYGGGGGSGSTTSSSNGYGFTESGRGGSGCIAIRIHLLTA